MSHPLMPKAVAVWLVDNTALTFIQIAEFCGLHELEVQALADGEIGFGILGTSPLNSGELTKEEIARCEKDTTFKLQIVSNDLPQPKLRSKGPRYTPVAKRGDKPNAIAYLLKAYPVLSDTQISRLIGTTKTTIEAVRSRTHASSQTIKAEDPIILGLCRKDELEKSVVRAEKKAIKEGRAIPKSEIIPTELSEAPSMPRVVDAPIEKEEEPEIVVPAAPKKQATVNSAADALAEAHALFKKD